MMKHRAIDAYMTRPSTLDGAALAKQTTTIAAMPCWSCIRSVMLMYKLPSVVLIVCRACMQVARQPAMECLPLVMEPESRFYSDPVAVLDFQSLYPSMVRAPASGRAGSRPGHLLPEPLA